MNAEEKMIPLSQATKMSKQLHISMCRLTIIKYGVRDNFARQVGGPGGKWYINEKKFKEFLNGQN